MTLLQYGAPSDVMLHQRHATHDTAQHATRHDWLVNCELLTDNSVDQMATTVTPQAHRCNTTATFGATSANVSLSHATCRHTSATWLQHLVSQVLSCLCRRHSQSWSHEGRWL